MLFRSGTFQKDVYSFDPEKRTVLSGHMLKEVCYEITVNFIIAKENNRAAPQGLALEMLEPYDGKLSCTVLRGPGVDNYPRLPDPVGTGGKPWR